MPEPELLVDQRDQTVDLVHPGLRYLAIEGASKVKRLQIVPPGEREVIITPGARDRQRQLVGSASLERPVVDGSDMLDHVHRVGEMVVISLCRCHACVSVASPEFPRTRHAAANQLVNQLYIGVCATTNRDLTRRLKMLWTLHR